MKRTPIEKRVLPSYTRGEEIFNMVSHVAGGGVVALAAAVMVVFAALRGDAWSVVGASIFAAALCAVYSVSGIYHGLRGGTAKKVMQVIDHCMIYFLIAGTYTPIVLSAMRRTAPLTAFTVFAVEWGFAALAATLTAIDLKKYSKFSFACYIGMGWTAIIVLPDTIKALTMRGFLWILAGGVFYTVGAIFFGLGKKIKYMHSVFHLFVVAGSLCHVIGVTAYAL